MASVTLAAEDDVITASIPEKLYAETPPALPATQTGFMGPIVTWAERTPSGEV